MSTKWRCHLVQEQTADGRHRTGGSAQGGQETVVAEWDSYGYIALTGRSATTSFAIDSQFEGYVCPPRACR
jgi:hypothetical protein